MENSPFPNDTKVINNGTKKVVVYFQSDMNRNGQYDYSVTISGDGSNDPFPGAAPFKIENFPCSNTTVTVESAKQYFDEKVKYYEEVLGVTAQPDLATKISDNIKNVKDKFISRITSSKKNDL